MFRLRKNLEPHKLYRFVFLDGNVDYGYGKTPEDALKKANIHKSWWPVIVDVRETPFPVTYC